MLTSLGQARRARRSRPVSKTESIPAPVGGLNARDAIANMPSTDAVVLENMFPTPTTVDLRNGSVAWATGLPGWVESLACYATSSRKLFAWSVVPGSPNKGALYEVTTAGAVGAALVTNLTNARWEYVNFNTAAGAWLYAFNAADKPLLYNGTTWTAIDGVSTPAITGVTTTKLRSPCVWKSRIWMVEDGTFNAWYLPVDSVGGAAQSLNVGSKFRMGGYLHSIFTVSISNANGEDDYIAFMSSEGEIALYRGTDPTQAGLFGQVGSFRCGRPIGKRATFRLAADTIIISADGAQPFSKLLMANRDQIQQTLSYKIVSLVSADTGTYASNFGWQGFVFPAGNKVILNVPQYEDNTQYQYVMNEITGSWTKFTGWNAACFDAMGDSLFYGGNGVVVQCDTGSSDQGAVILGKCKPAFSYFGSHYVKDFKMCRPVLSARGSIKAAISLNVNYVDQPPTSYTAFSGSTGTAWNVGAWNVSPWQVAVTVTNQWIDVAGTGFAASAYIYVASSGVGVSLQSIDYLFEPGSGVLG